MSHDPIFDIFREEAREHLGGLEKQFLDLETAALPEVRRELINSLFRHAHSLKGDAKVVGLDALKKTAQGLEDILDELRAAPEQVNRGVIDQGLAQFDRVRAAFEAWDRGSAPPPAETQEGPAAPRRRAGGVSPLIPFQGREDEVPAEPRVASQSAGGSGAPPPDARPPAAPAAEETFTVRVPSERLDRMLNLAGELRISQRSADGLRQRLQDLTAQLSQSPRAETSGAGLSAEQLATRLGNWQRTLLDHVRRIESDLAQKRSREELLVAALETDIREARLLPLVMLTDTFRRAVRDLAQSLGKPLQYEADVGQILLDKAVIEALKEPLLHLIRNAADHGIEPPAERAAAGKPETGLIRIQATRRGELVRITVSDDGRGINYDRIRARIRQAGELDEAALGQLSEAELREYLFRPGFTTAKTGEVSGRGVGLDVVRHTVQRLQGTVGIEAAAQAGTVFAITVPVTISTVRILTVLSGGQSFGVPSHAIVRTGQARREDLRELEGGLVLPIDGEPVRWVHLADLVGTAAAPRGNQGQAWSYLLIAHHGKQTAVAVDDLEDEAEVLLKPLGFPLSVLPGIVGATIRADGAVQLVLDLTSPAWSSAAGAGPLPRSEPQATRRILVVDDSPTTRAVLRNVLTAAGYAVWTAADGVEALERLQAQAVDLVVADVEMPRLNGLDLTRQVKLKWGLPVILVTAKEQEEHRRAGLEAGADAYVVKSTFQGAGLLDIVQQFV